MNGENKALLKALQSWGNERHKENLAKFDAIFERMNGLPCGSQIEKSKNILFQIRLLWTGFFSVIVLGIILGVWIR